MDKQNLKSEAMQSIIDYKPNWVIKRGLFFCFCVILSLLASTYFIRVPETIDTKIKITAKNPVIRLVPKIAGIIDTILIDDNQFVQLDDIVCIIKSDADVNDILYLKEHLSEKANTYDLIKKIKYYKSHFKSNLILGEIQPQYLNFLSIMRESDEFLSSKYYDNKKTTLETQLKKYKKIDELLSTQAINNKNRVKTLNSKYDLQKGLLQDSLISKDLYLTLENQHLNEMSSIEVFELSQLNNQILISQNEIAIQELIHQRDQELKKYKLQIELSLNEMFNAIALWENRYVIKALSSGRLVMLGPWEKNLHLSSQSEFAAVEPMETIHVGQAFISNQRAGKIKEGQRVMIKLDDYPHEEYGMLQGTINQIASISTNQTYLISVDLKNSLTTSYGTNLPFKAELYGQAEIVTDDLKLSERIFHKLITNFR